MMLADAIVGLVLAMIAVVAGLSLLRARRRRRERAWRRNRAALQHYHWRVLPRELFRRWRPTPRLTYAPRPATTDVPQPTGRAAPWPGRLMPRRRPHRAF